MTKVNILNIDGKKSSALELPAVFDTPFRPDVIKRAVLSEQTTQKQPQGRYKLAGKLVTATSLGPGRGISKVPRMHGSRTHHGQRGTLINSTVGGRLAHPPLTEKRIVERINKKEKRLALWSAVSATADKETVEARGHLFDDNVSFPLVVEDSLNELSKTSEVVSTLSSLGLSNDLERSNIRKVRAGKGKMRGRKYRTKTGPLLIVADDCSLVTAARNLAGVEVCKVQDLTVERLAPGTHAGRLTVWTESALKSLENWR